MVVVPDEVVSRYERFSLYNSPYPAHDQGDAIDLYPADDTVPSPVAGRLVDAGSYRCPPRAYAANEDYLVLIDTGDHIARILHVEPAVEVGQRVAVGEPLGTAVRSGFFGRWVGNHLHLEFRDREASIGALRRPTGALPLDVETAVSGVAWDGTGTVIETGPTHVRLDAPTASGPGFAAIASDDGVPLDGGLVHYLGGGAFASTTGPLQLLGTTVGRADGRDVVWRDVAIIANRQRATGLSLAATRGPAGAKLVFADGHDFRVGESVRVVIEPSDDPIHLG